MLLAKGQISGEVTLAELGEALPEESYSAAQIEDVLVLLAEEHINVVEK